MIKIKKEIYKNFYNISEEMHGRIGLLGVMDGICKGSIYSDSETNPGTALFLTDDGNVIVGDQENEIFNAEMLELFKTEAFGGTSHIAMKEKWINPSKAIFQSYISDPVKRYFYSLNDINSLNTTTDLDPEYRLFKVTPESLITLKDYKNFKNVNNECLWWWKPYTPSEKFNFGYVVIKDKTIITRCSLCQESSSQNICELDIETIEEGFRRQGFAVAVAHATIKEAFRVGYDKIAWGSYVSNIGSWKTAEKLGFTKVGENYLSWLKK